MRIVRFAMLAAVLAATPASAQQTRTLLNTTMTIADVNGDLGWLSGSGGTPAAMTFSWQGQQYLVVQFTQQSGDLVFQLGSTPVLPHTGPPRSGWAASRTSWRTPTTTARLRSTWASASLGWTLGASVNVRLTIPAPDERHPPSPPAICRRRRTAGGTRRSAGAIPATRASTTTSSACSGRAGCPGDGPTSPTATPTRPASPSTWRRPKRRPATDSTGARPTARWTIWIRAVNDDGPGPASRTVVTSTVVPAVPAAWLGVGVVLLVVARRRAGRRREPPARGGERRSRLVERGPDAGPLLGG